jgi:hypothetical protein
MCPWEEAVTWVMARSKLAPASGGELWATSKLSGISGLRVASPLLAAGKDSGRAVLWPGQPRRLSLHDHGEGRLSLHGKMRVLGIWPIRKVAEWHLIELAGAPGADAVRPLFCVLGFTHRVPRIGSRQELTR